MTAPLSAGWGLWNPRNIGGPMGASLPGVPFLPDVLGPDAALVVEAAFGASVNGDPAVWHWLDITRDVRVDPGIDITLGRANEAAVSQPATCTLVLDNSSGSYSLGGQSPNWPYIRSGTPIRVSLNPGGMVGLVTQFQGYADGWSPGWDAINAEIPVATLSASGSFRRIMQGKAPLGSSLYRHITLVAHPDDYWPLEESKTATQGLSAVGGNPAELQLLNSAGTLYGKAQWGGDTENPATVSAPTVIGGGGLVCAFTPELNPFTSNYIAICFSFKYSALGGAFVNVRCANGKAMTSIWYTDGSIDFFDDVGTVLSIGAVNPSGFDQIWHDYCFTMSGSTWGIWRDGVFLDSGTAAFISQPLTMEFISAPNPGAIEEPIAIAHVASFHAQPDLDLMHTASRAHVGEIATTRLTRLCAQENTTLETIGTSDKIMGPQLPKTFIELLRECETVDQGLLHDGLSSGLRYICRTERENQTTDLTVLGADLISPFNPTHDDQATRNKVLAESSNGAKYLFQDVTGRMGTSVIGIYDSNLNVNTSDANIQDYAGWGVHLGTVEGYRYPSVSMNMRATPTYAPLAAQLTLSSRLTVTQPGSSIAAFATDDIDLLVEGLALHFDNATWRITFKSSLYDPWVIGTLADDLGDISVDVERLETDSAVLAADYAIGTTSISVTTATGPIWTTVSDDFTVDLDIGGLKVTASAVSGASSPQTFTVASLTHAQTAGTQVRLWKQPALGL